MANRKAFTLVELLVVIAIIALLISILAPSLKIAKDIAKITICSTNMRGSCQAIQLYAYQYKGVMVPYKHSAITTAAYGVHTPWDATRAIKWSTATTKLSEQCFALVYAADNTINATLFYCPSQTDEFSRSWYPDAWDSHGVPEEGAGAALPWHTTISYMLNPNMTPSPAPKESGEQMQKYQSFDKFPSDAPIVTDMIGVASRRDEAAGRYAAHLKPTPTWNMGFADGHVSAKSSKAVYDFIYPDYLSKNGWSWTWDGMNNPQCFPLLLKQ